MELTDTFLNEKFVLGEEFRVNNSSIEEIRNLVISRISELYDNNKQLDSEYDLIYKDEENDMTLCIHQGKRFYFLGIENGNVREYISCSKQPLDMNYTVETIDQSVKGMVYSYMKAPEIVFNNSQRIISKFRTFFDGF